jgi:hypothetical protein
VACAHQVATMDFWRDPQELVSAAAGSGTRDLVQIR